MKKITLIFTVFFFAAFSWQSNAQLSYDNTCTTSFDDISATGTVILKDDGVTPLDDDGEGTITMPFSFTLDGVSSADLRVGNNGGVLFGVTTGDVNTGSTPTVPGFYPFVDDIDSDTGSVVWETLGTAPNRRVVIMWNDRNHYDFTPPPSPTGATFELILFETTNEITFLYQDTDFGDPTYDDAVSAGIRVVGANGVYVYSTNTALAGVTCINWVVPTCLPPSGLAISAITETGAELAWTDNAGTMNYEYVVQPTGTGMPTMAGTATTTNPQTLSGLTGSTVYEAYLRADCGGGDFSDWIKVDFGTACGAFGDFIENFDATTVNEVPLCWSTIVTSTSTTARVGVRNNTANTEPNSIEFYNGNDISETREFVLITPQLTDLPSDTHRIRFMASGGAEYGLLVGTMTDPTDVTTFHPVTGVTVVAGFNSYIVNFTGSTTDTYVAIKGILPTTFDTIKLDDFNWEPIPTCIEPSGITASAASDISAIIGWTDGNMPAATEWEYVIQAPGTGEPTMAGTATMSNPVTDTSLTANTDYEVYVRAKCGATDYSLWSGPVTFSTPCSPFIPDYTEDFTTFVPDCWVEADSGDPTTGPADFGSGGWLAEEFAHAATSGLGAVNINLFFNTKSDWIISPQFDLSAGGYELVFDVALTNYNSAAADTMGSDDEVQLVMSEDGGTTWSNMMTWNAANQPATSGETVIITLTSTGTNVQFAFWATDGTANDTEDYDFHLDNFIIRTPPSCYPPGSVAAMNVTDVSADLSWVDGANMPAATTWDVEWGATGFTQGMGTMIAATTDNPVLLTGLTAVTGYEFYVRTVCSGVDQSEWIGPVGFTTLDTPPANDDACDAVMIVVNAAPTVGNNIGGTQETGEAVPSCWDFPGNQNTVWFTFVAVGVNATVSTDFATALTDTSIAVYSGTDCADLTTFTEIGCDEDSGTVQNYNSIADVTGLTVGDTYYVQVEGYNNNVGEFNIEVTGFVASLNDLSNVGFSYYPNPVTNDLTMTANENITSISIFNMLGQEVRSSKPSALEANIDMSNLSSGAYFVKAQVGDSVGTFKVIKK